MKRILSVILSVSLIVSLFACNTFSAFAADQEVQATETTETVVVNHYTDATTMGTAAGIQSLKDDGDITTGSVLLNGDLANHKYKLTSYVGSTPTETNPHIQLKGLANNPYGSNDLNANSLKRQTGTKTAKGTDCYAFTEGRDSKGYYQIYSYGDSSANNGYGDQFGIEYLDIENTDANARAKAVVQYDLGDGWNVSDLVLGWGDTQYRAGYYVVLTSANGKDYIEQYRYTSDKIGDSTVTNSNVQHIKLKTPVYAKYVQIHFYAAVNSVASANFKDMIVNNSVIRVKTIQIFGVPEFEFDDHGTYSNSTDANYVIPAATEDTYKNEVLDNRTSLVAGLTPVASNYFVSSESAVGTNFDNGDGTLKDAYTYDAKTAFALKKDYAPRFTDGDLFNNDLRLSDDAAIKAMFINVKESNLVLKTNLIDDESKQWIQLDYDLGFTANVSQFALVGKTKPRYNASHYKYYVSDTADGLYKEENCVAEIGTPAAIGSVTLNAPKKGRYVGIRFICIHNTELHPSLSVASLYSRATEFAVFGSHENVAEANVAIATEEGVPSSLIQKGEPVYTGKTDSYGKYGAGTVALTATDYYEDIANKKAYTFIGWYNDEEPVSDKPEYTYDLTGGDVVLTAKYDVKKLVTKHTVTFEDWDGTELKTETVEEGNAATAPANPAREGYTFTGWDVAFDNVTSDLTVTAQYKINEYTVTFKSVTGVELGKVVVAEGDVPADVDSVMDQIKAINANVKTVYGYNIMRKDNGDVVWDADVYDTGIVNNITVTPRYEAIEGLNTKVKVYDVYGTKLIDQDARYDSAIYLASRQGAKSWTDAKEGGNVLIAKPTGTLYACGSAMEIYAKAEALEAEKVAIVGKNHEAREGFSIFAHVNVEGATAYGFIFASSKYYNEKEENKDFRIEDLTPNRVTNVEVNTANVEGKVDFMTTLNYDAKLLPNPTRYARAYVVVNNEYIYSDVICNK